MSLFPTIPPRLAASMEENLAKSIPEIVMDKYRYSDSLTCGKSSCPTDCHQCCYDFFYISEMEFLTIIAYVKKHLGGFYLNEKVKQAKEDLQIFASLYPQKYNEMNIPHPTALLNHSEAKGYLYANYDDFINGTTTRLTTPCVFLNPFGRCDIYPVRPMVCRMYGSYRIRFSKGNCCANLKKARLHILSKKERENLTRDELLLNGIMTRNFPIIDFLGSTYPRMEKICNKFYLNPSGFTLEEFIQSKFSSLHC